MSDKIRGFIFAFIFYSPFHSQGSNPLAISGTRVHSILGSKPRPANDTSTNLVFVRDPFSKIYSAYVDKVYLSSMFPNPIFEAKFITKFNKTRQDHQFASLNISFTDTVRYASGVYTKTLRDIERHFQPSSHFCNVCSIKYDVIGKIESFNTDVKFFLDTVNRSDIFDAMGDVEESNAESIVVDVIKRTAKQLKEKTNPSDELCSAFFKRTWQVFKLRGLISDEFSFPVDLEFNCNSTNLVDDMMRAAVKAVHNSTNRGLLKRQKQRYFDLAFKSVPLADLKRFQETILNDCALFNYDCEPPEIFAGRDGTPEENLFSSMSFSL